MHTAHNVTGSLDLFLSARRAFLDAIETLITAFAALGFSAEQARAHAMAAVWRGALPTDRRVGQWADIPIPFAMSGALAEPTAESTLAAVARVLSPDAVAVLASAKAMGVSTPATAERDLDLLLNGELEAVVRRVRVEREAAARAGREAADRAREERAIASAEERRKRAIEAREKDLAARDRDRRADDLRERQNQINAARRSEAQ